MGKRMPAKRVLLAEDEPNIVVSLRFLLERAGYAVAVRDTGDAALAAALGETPDVVILDVMLPGLDGFEILGRLRADGRTARLPVIMLTAKGQAKDRARAEAVGADHFISKPFANAEVVDAVRRLAHAPVG